MKEEEVEEPDPIPDPDPPQNPEKVEGVIFENKVHERGDPWHSTKLQELFYMKGMTFELSVEGRCVMKYYILRLFSTSCPLKVQW